VLNRILNPAAALIVVFSLPGFAQSPATIGELFASEATAHGPALLAGSGMTVLSGSQVSAGKAVATFRLARGGDIRICPQSSLTANAVPGTDALMLAMNTSSVEINYPVNDVADTLLTPDFKLLLAGPGIFHFAVGVNSRGDTCIKPLRGNSSSIIVSEIMGTSVYQVKSDEAVLFTRGKLNARGEITGPCGCPTPPSPPVIRAETQRPKLQTDSDVTAPLPPEKPGEIRVQVDAPLVFRGDAPAQQTYTVAKVNFSALPDVFSMQEDVKPTVLTAKTPEVSAKVKQKKGFFGRLKGFFASIFRK
jgi:hypothetical protein